MAYATNINQYIENLTTNILPQSDLGFYPANRNGLIQLGDFATPWHIQLPKSVEAGLYLHEKSSTTRYGILANQGKSVLNPAYHSYYFKPFTGGMQIFQNIMAQSILELYPTPISTYGAITSENNITAGVIDVNHLVTKEGNLPVQSIRFDMLLHQMGLGKEINSFVDLQNFINNENTKKLFSERAIVQLGLCSYFIPNAIGEVDANSRNIIILKDPITQKYEYVIRIDAESNTYFNDLNNERSGKKVLPKGIFNGNELFETEFLRAIREKDSSIDWKLFTNFTNLAQKFTTRSNIDNAIFNGYRRNYGRATLNPYEAFTRSSGTSVVEMAFGSQAYADFSNATIERAKRYHNSVCEAFGIYSNELNMPFEKMEISKPNNLKQKNFNEQGVPLTPEEEAEFGLE